jgi:Na+/H+ antiporter NhaD/arsenite permease-like protein
VAAGVLIVFALVYLAMLLGELPGLALDRTGAALLGAIVLVATELVSPQQAWTAIDTPTLCLLFGLMVVSAQLRLGGFYDQVTRRIAAAPLAPTRSSRSSSPSPGSCPPCWQTTSSALPWRRS